MCYLLFTMKKWKKIKIQRAIKSSSVSALNELSPEQIILKPLITEKSLGLINDKNTYVFHVHHKANKNDVKASVKYLFNVDAISVRTVQVPYKSRMQRKMVRKAYKKAFVSLAVGSSIEFVA